MSLDGCTYGHGIARERNKREKRKREKRKREKRKRRYNTEK